MSVLMYIHTPTGVIFSLPIVVLEEIVRVAIEQKDVEWPMSCYEDALRLKRFIDTQKH